MALVLEMCHLGTDGISLGSSFDRRGITNEHGIGCVARFDKKVTLLVTSAIVCALDTSLDDLATIGLPHAFGLCLHPLGLGDEELDVVLGCKLFKCLLRLGGRRRR